jgi:hypothetical protein
MEGTLSTAVRHSFRGGDSRTSGLSPDQRHKHVDKLCMNANKLCKPLFCMTSLLLPIF